MYDAPRNQRSRIIQQPCCHSVLCRVWGRHSTRIMKRSAHSEFMSRLRLGCLHSYCTFVEILGELPPRPPFPTRCWFYCPDDRRFAAGALWPDYENQTEAITQYERLRYPGATWGTALFSIIPPCCQWLSPHRTPHRSL